MSMNIFMILKQFNYKNETVLTFEAMKPQLYVYII